MFKNVSHARMLWWVLYVILALCIVIAGYVQWQKVIKVAPILIVKELPSKSIISEVRVPLFGNPDKFIEGVVDEEILPYLKNSVTSESNRMIGVARPYGNSIEYKSFYRIQEADQGGFYYVEAGFPIPILVQAGPTTDFALLREILVANLINDLNM